MKITLNLLPKKRKDKIRDRKIVRLIIWLEIMLILASIFVIAMAFGIGRTLDVQLESIDRQFYMESSRGNYAEIKRYEEVLDEVKKEIIIIDNVQRNEINWIDVFKKINENVPQGIVLSYIENNNYKLVLSGVADSRDTLMEMKSSLENNECFGDVSVPLNNIVLRNNINFNLDLNVKKECLKYYEKK